MPKLDNRTGRDRLLSGAALAISALDDENKQLKARVVELESALKRIQASADLIPECGTIRAILRELKL